ncbi:U2 snRNP component Hsh155p [Trichomonascus vanleenenianus]|uniref:U2 snRNP complex subunit HSH155 n=1 Tax=Trichomonascus vanleenenianus TaxID=2268995 RepID=UPI003EC9D4F0
MSDAEIRKLREIQEKRKALKAKNSRGVAFGTPDSDLYGDGGEYVDSIAPGAEMEEDGRGENGRRKLVGQYTASKELMNEFADADYDPAAEKQQKRTIYDRESGYQRRRFNRELSKEEEEESYEAKMERRRIEEEEQRVRQLIEGREKQQEEEMVGDKTPPPAALRDKTPPRPSLIRDKTPPPPSTKIEGEKRSRWGEAPEDRARERRSRWDEKPSEPIKKRSRWDETPEEGVKKAKESEDSVVKVRLTDEMLDQILPSEGYEILEPPASYIPIRGEDEAGGISGFTMAESGVSARKLVKSLPTEIPGVGDLQYFKQSDMKYFSKLLETEAEEAMALEDRKERKIMRLLLRIKNGTPPVRKQALREITDNARFFGAQALFSQLLDLLRERDLEDQERHLLVKVVDRVLYKLGDLVRPYTHRILVVIEPLLIDEDPYARIEGKEVISNLAKAAGLAQMISTLRPDIDHSDEYVRNATSRAFAIVASALGIPSLLPFLKAVCRSKKSWYARHTGVKIVQQIAILVGCAVLPHLNGLVECIAPGLTDEQFKVRTITALALSSLAEAAAPYGIESFEVVLDPLWRGIRHHRGKGLAAFLQCVGNIVPLMDPEYANYYTRELMDIVLREFNSPDDDMKKVVLRVVQQCASTEGVKAQYLREEVLPSFFKYFWVRRMALDKRNNRLVVYTTVELAGKVGVSEIIERVVLVLKDESEPFRRMAVETVDKVIGVLGVADISERMEERLVDGVLTAFQSQTVEDKAIIDGFGTVVNALGYRTKPYIPQIVSSILFRLGNQSPTVRQQAADLISKLADVMKVCNENALMGKIGSVLYEQLGEEYPEVLGSILGALENIVRVVGLSSMQPPIRDLLPRLTPILRNRHEKVQENAIKLVGRIADRGADYVSPREWMRICNELIDMLRAHKKDIRKAANNTFGYIAKAIGPQDVLATLLTSLRVQERQQRVSIAVAIGIVAETCLPFTVLPVIMNEYRVPERNVQNGVLKSLTFMFEYIGPMAEDYIYAITPLIEDGLMDYDLVHRQTAATVVKHLALGTVGMGCEDTMIHFLNMLWPNLYETSPHVIDRILDGITGVRNAVGCGIIMNYVLAGLFHAARKVRTPYWRVYNAMYVQSSDAMVPYYPALKEEEFHRPEFDIFI